MRASSVNVIIADPHFYFRQGILYALQSQKELRIAGQVADSKELLQILPAIKADVLVLSSELFGADPMDLIRQVRSVQPSLRFIVFALQDDPALVRELLDAGVSGYLLKQEQQDSIAKALLTVTEGEVFFTDLVNRALLTRIKRNAFLQRANPIRFSKREVQVLSLLADGLTTHEVAAKIFSSPRTVENIRLQLKVKTGVNTTSALIVYAFRNKLIK